MTSTTSKTQNQTVEITPEIVRAFADFLEAGNTGSLTDFASSDAGKAAAMAMADQKAAELRSAVMGNARAVAKDMKVNNGITQYSGDRAKSLLAFLSSVDFENLPESLPMPKREKATTDGDDATE